MFTIFQIMNKNAESGFEQSTSKPAGDDGTKSTKSATKGINKNATASAEKSVAKSSIRSKLIQKLSPRSVANHSFPFTSRNNGSREDDARENAEARPKVKKPDLGIDTAVLEAVSRICSRQMRMVSDATFSVFSSGRTPQRRN